MTYRIGPGRRCLHGRRDRRPDRRAGAPSARPGPGAADGSRFRPADGPADCSQERRRAGASSPSWQRRRCWLRCCWRRPARTSSSTATSCRRWCRCWWSRPWGSPPARSGRLGLAIGAALVAYSLGFVAWTNFDPSLQRPDWRAAAATLGEPTQPRAMVTWMLGAGVLRHYLPSGSFQVVPGERWFIGEVDLISNGPAPPGRPPGLAPSFRRHGARTVGRFEITRYVDARVGPGLRPQARASPRSGSATTGS